MDKKGKFMGRILSTFPILLIIFIFLIVYLFLAGLMYGAKVPSVPNVISGIDFKMNGFEDYDFEGILMESVNVEVNGDKKNVFVYYAFILVANNELEIYPLRLGLSEVVERGEGERCLLIAQGNMKEPISSIHNGEGVDSVFITRYDGRNTRIKDSGSIVSEWRIYEDDFLKYKSLFKDVSFLDKYGREIYLQYYYGGCLE